MWHTQAFQHETDSIIQALERELNSNNPRSMNSNSISSDEPHDSTSCLYVDSQTDCFSEERASAALQYSSLNLSEVQVDIHRDSMAYSEVLPTIVRTIGSAIGTQDFSSATSRRFLNVMKSVTGSSKSAEDIRKQRPLIDSPDIDHVRSRGVSSSYEAYPRRLESLHSYPDVTFTNTAQSPSLNVELPDLSSCNRAAGRIKVLSKKRSRASAKPLTTVLETDCSNFRAMVQQVTGMVTLSPAFPNDSHNIQQMYRHEAQELTSSDYPTGLVKPQPARPSAAAFSGQNVSAGFLSKGDPRELMSFRPVNVASGQDRTPLMQPFSYSRPNFGSRN